MYTYRKLIANTNQISADMELVVQPETLYEQLTGGQKNISLSQLVDKIKLGDSKFVLTYIKEGGNINAVFQDQPILFFAFYNPYETYEALNLLIGANADDRGKCRYYG